MLPKFPKFKKLELSDKANIEKITDQYLPFSDFNFISMWSWDIKEEMMVSTINNGLAVMFTDYITSEPFYSFLGGHDNSKTAGALINFSIENDLKPKLNLVPEAAVKGLRKVDFRVEEDIDNFDYIFDVKKLAAYSGGAFADKRTMVNNFLRKYPKHEVRLLNLKQTDAKKELIDLNECWLKNKIKEDQNFKIKNEFTATRRFLEANFDDLICVGIFVDSKIVGYSIFQTLPQNYATCHFSKADISIDGVYEFLMKESAKILSEHKVELLNYEQDLGLPGLRYSKNSFRPVKFLKKYSLKPLLSEAFTSYFYSNIIKI